MYDAQVVKFDKDAIDIDCVIKLGFTGRAYRELQKASNGQQESFVAYLSGLKRLIAVPRKDESTQFDIQTPYGSFLCGVNQKTGDGFSVIFWSENDLYQQNLALKHGVIFSVNNGISVEVLLPKENVQYRYLSGVKYDYNAIELGNTLLSVSLITDALAEASAKDNGRKTTARKDELPAEESAVPDLETIAYRDILKQSAEYSRLSSELEEKKTKEMGRMSYREFEAASYDRVDRVAYTFLVDEIDKSVFKPGVQVELEGRRGERINGEIVETDDHDKDNIRVTVLFNQQVDQNSFQSFGTISLSFSTVNKEVQIGANNRLRDGTAKAAFLKPILGGKRTNGFERKDLRRLEQTLSQKKYPPNPSQMDAIKRGINTKDIMLVMGPPGTGKTTVILEWVKYFVNVEHKRVLISSQNNKAVDNVLARLAEEKDIDVIRIGSEAKLQQEVIPYMFENKLKTLNDSIDRATRDASEAIQNSICAWEDYRKRFFVFDRQLQMIRQLDETLRDALLQDVIPIRKKMKDLLDEYNRSRRDYDTARKNLDGCIESIRAYERRNVILKKLTEKQYQTDLAARDQLNKAVENCGNRARNAAKRYNTAAVQCETQMSLIRNRYVSDMKRVRKKKTEGVSGFQANTPFVPSVAGLFESINVTEADLMSPVGLATLIKKIDDEIARARSVLAIEEGWRDAVVGKQHYALNEIVLETVDLVGATCIGVSSQKRFANLHFDVTIIDEAGQIQIHNALVPMSVSEKLIMLGDYKQIPPSADRELTELCEANDIDPELLQKSLFEKMFLDLPDTNKAMLDTQFRMPGEIADTISEWFYEGKYKSHESKRNLKGLLPSVSEKPFVVIDTSAYPERFEKRTPERGTLNVCEAEICREILRHIIDTGADIGLNEIGIISAYGDQVSTIKKTISKVVTPEQANAMVATLDSFQGQERDLIMYSFTKSSKKKATLSRIGFLNELRRLNVAMSRCKKMLVMIGDMRFLGSCAYQDTDEDGNGIYEHSEKEFSDFIKKMLDDVQKGRGEMMPLQTLKERIHT